MRPNHPLRTVSGIATATLIASALAAPLAAQQTPTGETWPDTDPELLEQARSILQEVPLIDGHNDLPSKILGDHDADPNAIDLNAPQPSLHTDFLRLREGLVGGQFWSAYVTTDSMGGAALRHGLREVDMVHRLVDAYPEQLEFARTADDIVRIHDEGKIASMIGLEGGHAIENSLAALRSYYDLGVRYMTLTHSRTHDWADASTDEPRHGGLSPFGEDVVREMNRIGMFVDISHVSAETMRDVLRVSEAPVIFSHSSARGMTDVPRNVPDDVLAGLSENGGVVMGTFVPQFVASGLEEYAARRDAAEAELEAELDDPEEIRRRMRDWSQENPRPRGTLGDMADHMEHMIEVAGIDHVGIGADYDGISSTIVGLEDVSRFPHLFAELLKRGYSEEDLKKVAGLNVLRAMRDMEDVAERLQAEMEPVLGN